MTADYWRALFGGMLIGAGAATLLLLTGGSSQSVAFVGGMIAGFFALRLLRGRTDV